MDGTTRISAPREQRTDELTSMLVTPASERSCRRGAGSPRSTSSTCSTRDAVVDALGMLDVPIVLDVEIGHVPPHLPLLNGGVARVVDGDTREITQTWR